MAHLILTALWLLFLVCWFVIYFCTAQQQSGGVAWIARYDRQASSFLAAREKLRGQDAAWLAGCAILPGLCAFLWSGQPSVLLCLMPALAGAGLGFLWFNAYPAQMFMGDVGSLGLGGVLAFLAVLCKQELLLLIVGGLFVAETLSVILQVSYFKASGGKRIFRMAPLHHHYEMKGIPESKIIIRFWIISVMLGLIALSALKLR